MKSAAVSLRCPHCGSARSRVLSHTNRSTEDPFLRRSRKCTSCSRNYMTREYVEAAAPLDSADIKVALSFLARATLTLTKGRKSRRN